MTAAPLPRLHVIPRGQNVVAFDPVKDKRYAATRLGRDVADFLAWLELGGASPRTLDQYERDLARGALMYPDRDAATLEDGDALHIAKQFKPAERRVRVAAWRSFYKWARKTRRATVNPFDALPDFKGPAQRVYDIFTEAEIATLCSLPVRDGAVMAIMLDEGLRKSECRNLRVRDYWPEAADAMPYGRVIVQTGKGKKGREVRATQRVAQLVNRLVIEDGLSDKDYLWYSVRANEISRKVMRSTPIGDGSFARWWERCLTDAEIRYRRPHETRHTFATRWLRNGGRLERLSTAMGHASIKTTYDLYGHLDAGDVAADHALIEAEA